MQIGLTDILKVAGFDPSVSTKLVRHKDARCSMEDLCRNNWNGQSWLDLYQCYQKDPVFHRARQIVSFYGLSGTRAAFYGMYNVVTCLPATDGPEIPPGQTWNQGCNHFYKLQRDQRFDELRDRLIIDWGQGTINWHQWLDTNPDKEVLEILAPGRRLPPFADYLNFSLPYPQLKQLFSNEEAHRDWKNPLNSVAGVYLILAETSGDMYVGSAYGTSGIWGRWRVYADSGHGGNECLRKLIESDSNYPARFRFSVLQILPISTTCKEVVKWEQLYKQKLGTRATGLNLN
jgi:hypothetical protein